MKHCTYKPINCFLKYFRDLGKVPIGRNRNEFTPTDEQSKVFFKLENLVWKWESETPLITLDGEAPIKVFNIDLQPVIEQIIYSRRGGRLNCSSATVEPTWASINTGSTAEFSTGDRDFHRVVSLVKILETTVTVTVGCFTGDGDGGPHCQWQVDWQP